MRKLIIGIVAAAVVVIGIRHLVRSGIITEWLDTHSEYRVVMKAQCLLASFYHLQGAHDKTIRQLEKFLVLYPKLEYRQQERAYLLAFSHELLNHRKTATELYRQFLKDYPGALRDKLIQKKIELLNN